MKIGSSRTARARTSRTSFSCQVLLLPFPGVFAAPRSRSLHPCSLFCSLFLSLPELPSSTPRSRFRCPFLPATTSLFPSHAVYAVLPTCHSFPAPHFYAIPFPAGDARPGQPSLTAAFIFRRFKNFPIVPLMCPTSLRLVIPVQINRRRPLRVQRKAIGGASPPLARFPGLICPPFRPHFPAPERPVLCRGARRPRRPGLCLSNQHQGARQPLPYAASCYLAPSVFNGWPPATSSGRRPLEQHEHAGAVVHLLRGGEGGHDRRGRPGRQVWRDGRCIALGQRACHRVDRCASAGSQHTEEGGVGGSSASTAKTVQQM